MSDPTAGQAQPAYPATTPGLPAPAQVPTYEPVQVYIGDIGVSESWITTPRGSAALKGSQWVAQDNVFIKEAIPAWAIVTAIVTGIFFCGLGFLFLLVKEPQTVAQVVVTVRSGHLQHTAYIPASNPQLQYQVHQNVQWAQAKAA